MRLFVGVAVDHDVRSAAAAIGKELQRRLDSRVRAAWIPEEKMHLTVRFIGHADESRVPAILDVLQPPLPMAPFDIVLDGCGAFPSSGPPRVIWIGLREGLSGLRAMHDEFNDRLRPLGFAPEQRPFNAHLTLARVKDVPRHATRTIRDTVTTMRVPIARCRVDHATVFQSQLSSKGSTYVPLVHVPCQPQH